MHVSLTSHPVILISTGTDNTATHDTTHNACNEAAQHLIGLSCCLCVLLFLLFSCDDKGYLQLVRTFSMFALTTLVIHLAQLFAVISDGLTLITKPVAVNRGQALMSNYAGETGYVAPIASYGGDGNATAAQQQAAQPAPQPYAAPIGVVPNAGTGYQNL